MQFVSQNFHDALSARTRSSGSTDPRSRASQSGQVGIIVILITVVLLTVGLSLASQSSTEVNLATQERQSTQVFNAAEGGVEQVLSTNLLTATQLSGQASVPGSNATVNYTISKDTAINQLRVPQANTAFLQLTDSTNTQTASSVNIDWGTETACGQKPATLLIAIFSADTSKTPINSVRYLAFAPCDYSDGITPVATTPTPANGLFRRVTIVLQPKDVFARIKPMYNDTTLQVSAAVGTLPVQGYTIRSTAVNQNGNETRSVYVKRSLSSAPSVMDYALFSGATLIQ